MGNSVLRRALRRAHAQVAIAPRDRLPVIVDDVCASANPVRFQTGPAWLAGLGLYAAAIGALLLGLRIDQWALVCFALSLAFVYGGTHVFINLYRDRRLLRGLPRALAARALAIDCAVQTCTPPPMSGLREFTRGNHANTVKGWMECLLDGRRWSTYHYHYVNARTETYTETDSEGRTQTRTRTVYDHYHRYGACVDFDQADGICFGRHSPGYEGVRWTTESRDFNKSYRAYAVNEHDAARFFRPSVVLMLLEHADRWSELSVEIVNARLWATVSKGPLLDVQPPAGLEKPDVLKAFLEQTQRPPYMEPLAWLVAELDRLVRR